MDKRFTKKVEDFVCGHCGTAVKGNGYTNHCPSCLWSKHVDNWPGDRAEQCGALMKPLRIEKTKEGFDIIHRCEKCGKEKKNKLNPEDNWDLAAKIAAEVSLAK
jgi:rubrerythrin